MKKLLIPILALFFAWPAAAQNGNPPVNVESLVANEGLNVTMSFGKKLQSFPKIGFFSVSSITTDWESSALVDLMLQGGVTYELVQGLDVFGGYHYVPVNGIHGSAGLRATIIAKDFLIVAVPRVDLYKEHSIEGFASVSYTPNIEGDLNFYSRAQGLYTVLTKDGTHQRSYAWFRLGLNYKDITFGLGANLDYYGPPKININNFGVFTTFDLF